MNNNQFLIVGWDHITKKVVKQFKKDGARFLWRIAFDANSQSVIFVGQSTQFVSVTLPELDV